MDSSTTTKQSDSDCTVEVAVLSNDIDYIRKKLDKIDATLNGNGVPGLKARVTVLETQMQGARRWTGDLRTAVICGIISFIVYISVHYITL